MAGGWYQEFLPLGFGGGDNAGYQGCIQADRRRCPGWSDVVAAGAGSVRAERGYSKFYR